MRATPAMNRSNRELLTKALTKASLASRAAAAMDLVLAGGSQDGSDSGRGTMHRTRSGNRQSHEEWLASLRTEHGISSPRRGGE
jgi:hypothetical protein